jgi:WD40 repeat protein
MLDLAYNRYQRINRLGVSCTAIAYNLKCKTEYLVATVDGTVKCFNTETRELVGWMKGHEKPVLGLCVQPSGSATLVVSHSHDLAQLWDVTKFECRQKLSVNSKSNVEIVKV